MFWFLAVRHQITLGKGFVEQGVMCNEGDEILFKSTRSAMERTLYIALLNIDAEDQVKYATKALLVPWESENLDVATDEQKFGVFENDTQYLYVLVKPSKPKYISAMGGESLPLWCIPKIFFIRDQYFDLATFIANNQLSYEKLCIVNALSNSTFRVDPTGLAESDFLYHLVDGAWGVIESPEILNTSVDGSFLSIVFDSDIKTQRSFDYYFVPPMGLPTSTPTPNPSSKPIPTYNSISTSVYDLPKPTRTPEPSWDGEWEDKNLIVRGEDVPEIRESYPPLQTEYVKTQIPKMHKVVNISVGTIIILVVVVLTIINMAKTYAKLYSMRVYKSSSCITDISLSTYTYYDYSESSIDQNLKSKSDACINDNNDENECLDESSEDEIDERAKITTESRKSYISAYMLTSDREEEDVFEDDNLNDITLCSNPLLL